MPRHRHDLVRRCAGVGQCRRGGFADAVRRAMRKIGLAAPILELVSEAVRRKRLAVFGNQYYGDSALNSRACVGVGQSGLIRWGITVTVHLTCPVTSLELVSGRSGWIDS